MALVNSNCYVALEEAVSAEVELVQLAGSSFHQHALGLSA